MMRLKAPVIAMKNSLYEKLEKTLKTKLKKKLKKEDYQI
jgi:hypothetical protein